MKGILKETIKKLLPLGTPAARTWATTLWATGNLSHWELGPPGTWATGNLGHLGTWATGNLGHRELGHLGTWATWELGPLGTYNIYDIHEIYCGQSSGERPLGVITRGQSTTIFLWPFSAWCSQLNERLDDPCPGAGAGNEQVRRR